jgi:hypothetical protein
MKKLLKLKLGILTIGALALTSTLTQAQTTANGPYYATPSWDQTLPASTRFIVLSNMGGNAVLDRETGLVWEQSPSAISDNYYNHSIRCMNLNTGGRTGWRLPTIQELLSLVDRSQVSPALPSGHPFSNVQPTHYWSASNYAQVASGAYTVYMPIGRVDVGEFKALTPGLAWCVRGGQGVDPQ